MATVSVQKSSLNVTSGGQFRRVTNVTTTEFTTTATQYAIVTVTAFASLSGASSSAVINIGGNTMMQTTNNGGANSSVVIYNGEQSLFNINNAPSGPIQIYVGPSLAFQTVSTGTKNYIIGSYVIFQNT